MIECPWRCKAGIIKIPLSNFEFLNLPEQIHSKFYLIIKKIAETVEADSKAFPVNTKEVHSVGQHNQVLVDHIQEVVLSRNKR